MVNVYYLEDGILRAITAETAASRNVELLTKLVSLTDYEAAIAANSTLSARYLEQTERADGLVRESEKDKEFVEKMFSACVYLDKAVPVFGRDNAERVRFATDEIIRLRAQLQAVTGLLAHAKCPNRRCDGQGTIATEHGCDPCEWCHRRMEALPKPTQEGGGGG